MNPRSYLEQEQVRNRNHADLFTAMVKETYGCDEAVLVGHHICFQHGNDIETENEIPAADTLIFDPVIMGAIFGERAVPIMQELAALPLSDRDERLSQHYYTR